MLFDVVDNCYELRWSSSDNTLKEPDASGSFSFVKNVDIYSKFSIQEKEKINSVSFSNPSKRMVRFI